jgi:AdoMet-dependent rRNA methyltransferase SPB1
LQADVVLHDGAPNVGQNWRKDAFTQSELVLCSLKLATEFLRPKGLFITKVFRSADYNSLLWVFNQFFEKVEATKPHSSRNASAEIFVVCKDYKAPDKIDPRLLDSRFVFKEIDETTGTSTGVAGGGGGQTLTVFDKRAAMHNKRQREGYDESLGVLLTKAMSITSFLASDNPVRVITDASSLRFDPAAVTAGVADHALTTGEIKACCQDLKVLGKKEFKGLLRWRYMMRKAFPTLVAGAQEVELSGSEGEESGSEEDGGEAESEESEDSDAEDLKHLSAEAQAECAGATKKRKRTPRSGVKLFADSNLG